MDQQPATSKQDQQRLQFVLGNALRTGVLIAAAVVCLGGVLYLVRHGAEPRDHSAFHGEPSGLRSVTGMLKEAIAGSGRGTIQLGLLLLIATPVMRVVLSLAAFVHQRDRTYAAVSLTVLLLLLYSLFGGQI